MSQSATRFESNQHKFPEIALNMIELVSVGHEVAFGSFVIEGAAGDATVGSTPAPAAGFELL
jgi:hypothetical protein